MKKRVLIRPRERGQVLVIVALFLVALVGLVGLALDGGYAFVQRSRVQAAADASSLAGAHELAVNPTEPAIYNRINDYAVTRNGATTLTAKYYPGNEAITGSEAIPGSATGVCVTPTSTYNTWFMGIFGVTTVTVGATGCGNVQEPLSLCAFCVLSGSANPALNVNSNAHLTVQNGGIDVNSSAHGGLTVGSNAAVTASFLGIVGADSLGSNGTVSPAPTTITAIPDPFADIPLPIIPNTNGIAGQVTGSGGTLTIYPGNYTYISSTGNATLTMSPGNYYITNSLLVGTNATLIANGVFLYFTCGGPKPAACLNTGQAGGFLQVDSNASATITGPTTGTYKGLPIFYDRNNTSPLTIASNAIFNLSGTIYAASGSGNYSSNGAILATRAVVRTATVSSNVSLTFTYDKTKNYPGTKPISILPP